MGESAFFQVRPDGPNVLGAPIVKESVARSTGTRILLLDRRRDGADEDGGRWETICEPHGAVCSHETRKLAESFMAAPEEWCEDCQYGPGALAGTNPDAPGYTGVDPSEEARNGASPDRPTGRNTHHPEGSAPMSDKTNTKARSSRSSKTAAANTPPPAAAEESKPTPPATIGLFDTLLAQAKAAAPKTAQVEKKAYVRVDVVTGDKPKTLAYLNNPSSKAVRVEVPRKSGGGYDLIKVTKDSEVPKAMKAINERAAQIKAESEAKAAPATA